MYINFTMEFRLVAVVGYLLLCLQTGLAQAENNWSSVTLAPCRVLLHNQPLSLCCHTNNIPKGAMVTFYNGSQSDVVARIRHPCGTSKSFHGHVTCDVRGTYVLYNFTFLQSLEPSDMGLWGCGFYGSHSTYVLDNKSVMSKNLGFQLATKGDNSTLTWIIKPTTSTSQNISLFDPGQHKILSVNNSKVTITASGVTFTGNITTGNISVTKETVTRHSNGTYFLQYQSQQEALTLVVLDMPQTPVIVNDTNSIVVKSNMAAGTIYCNTSSRSAAPLYYYASFNFTWLVPGQSYNTSWRGNQLNFSKVDCAKQELLPVLCQVKEGSISSHNSQPFYPQSLCDPSTTAAAVTTDNGVNYFQDDYLTFFLVVVILFAVIGTVARRRFIYRQIQRFMNQHCCTRYQPSDNESDSDSQSLCLEIVLARKTMTNWEQERQEIHEAIERSQLDIVGLPTDNPSFGTQSIVTNREEERQAIRDAIERSQLDMVGLPTDNPSFWTDSEGGEGGDMSPQNQEDENDGEPTASTSTSAPPTDELKLLGEVEQMLTDFNSSLTSQAFSLEVRRDTVMDNMICHYTDSALAMSRVVVKVIGEDGMDCGGVMEDIYTTFWNRIQEQFFKGCEAVVPYLATHQLQNEENFRVIGRILSHSVALMKSVPLPMCKSAIIVMIFDTTQVARNTLLEDFLFFLDIHDRELLTKGMTDFQSLSHEQVNEIQDIFTRFDYGAVVKEDKLMDDLEKIARNTICIKPKQLLDLMRSGIPFLHMKIFWNRLHHEYLYILYRALKPTATRIIASLSVHPDETSVNSEKRKAFRFLQRLLRDLTDLELATFLQFTTGQKSTPRQPIQVTFTNERGFRRAPKAHTCSNLLELPATYSNYEQFKSEFKHLLAADEAMIFSMA